MKQLQWKPVAEDTYNYLITLLRGSEGYRIATQLSFCLAVVIVFGGIYFINLSHEHRVISVLAMLYLISSTFTLTKTMRDKLLSRILEIPLLGGTPAWSVQCQISFCIALLASVYAAFSLSVHRSVKGFVVVGLSFALSSTISLAKYIRDQSDADYFEKQEMNEYNYEKMANLVWGSHDVYGQVTWLFFALDTCAFIYALKEFQLNSERTDFLAMGVAFMVYASLLLAKAVRDNESKDALLHPSNLHWTMYVTACLVSTGLLFHTILRLMPLSTEKRAFFTLNTVCILSATFNLAKSVRDQEEIMWQQEEGGWDVLKFQEKCCK